MYAQVFRFGEKRIQFVRGQFVVFGSASRVAPLAIVIAAHGGANGQDRRDRTVDTALLPSVAALGTPVAPGHSKEEKRAARAEVGPRPHRRVVHVLFFGHRTTSPLSRSE